MEWLTQQAKAVNLEIRQTALEHQANLTKPAGSLGALEEVAITLCGLQDTMQPRADSIFITVFAADHGVAEEGVSAFPQIVTAEMVKNFARGGAAVSVLARQLNARLRIVNLGTVGHADLGIKDGSASQRGECQTAFIAHSTANMCHTEAMSKEQLNLALTIGRDLVDDVMFSDVNAAASQSVDLFIGGDMGIANTTSASAILCALMQAPPTDMVGPGTGVDVTGIHRKIAVVERALALHKDKLDEPLAVLRCLGGFEIVALVGSYIHCAQRGIPILIDGFVTTAAAVAALQLNPSISPWFIFAHQSAEPAHALALAYCQANPLLDLNMRLGEASGAAVAVPLIRLACALHTQMASFKDAGVSTAS